MPGEQLPDGPATLLATALSIAVRIEPELIRAVRLDVFPYLDVSAESDLWFSDALVGSRDPDAIVLQRELLPELRRRLAAWLAASRPADPVRSLWTITARVHASASPALLLEERVAWLAARARPDASQAIEKELSGALNALVGEGRTGVADWLVGAWPRLPEAVRETKTAWLLHQAASLRADASRLPPAVAPAGIGLADVATLAGIIAPADDVMVPVRLAGGVLELGEVGTQPGTAVIPLLDTDPRIVSVLTGGPRRSASEESAEMVVAVPRGGRAQVAVGPGEAQLLTPRGLVYRVVPYTPPRMLVPLPGSNREPVPDAVHVGPVDPQVMITITLVLRRRAELPQGLVESPDTVTGEELSYQYGADPADVEAVADVLQRFGLTILTASAGSRRVRVSGPAGVLAQVFGTSLTLVSRPDPGRSERVVHRYRTGGLSVPVELDGIVIAVLGLDDRPQARLCVQAADGKVFRVPLTPEDVRRAYDFPASADGTGQSVNVVALDVGGYPAPESPESPESKGFDDVDEIRQAELAPGIIPGKPWLKGIAAYSFLTAMVLVSALAPGTRFTMIRARNTDAGLFNALCDAIHYDAEPTAIYIVWGEAEDSWTQQARTVIDLALADAAALGITVCAAVGDGGSESYSRDRQSRVFFPASSPYALACGGTTLEAEPGIGAVRSEAVWRATGGGISDSFALPSWQASAVAYGHAQGGGTGRGVPDVAANADPETGYRIGGLDLDLVLGGTGTSAALWAALVCLLVQATGRRLGLLQPVLYAGADSYTGAPGFTSITAGNNGAYQAGPGWDPCTGLGTPRGTELLSLLSGSSPVA